MRIPKYSIFDWYWMTRPVAVIDLESLVRIECGWKSSVGSNSGMSARSIWRQPIATSLLAVMVKRRWQLNNLRPKVKIVDSTLRSSKLHWSGSVCIRFSYRRFEEVVRVLNHSIRFHFIIPDGRLECLQWNWTESAWNSRMRKRKMVNCTVWNDAQRQNDQPNRPCI